MIHLTLSEHPDGVAVESGVHAVYELDSNTATFGAARTDRHSLVFSVGESPAGGQLLRQQLDLEGRQLMRCDRVDFPAGGVAYPHTHPGPGIRCGLLGHLTVTSAGETGTYGRLESWFESGPDPVYAEASTQGPAAFVRVMILPIEWAGKRTISYVDPTDEGKPKRQTATVFFEHEVTL